MESEGRRWRLMRLPVEVATRPLAWCHHRDVAAFLATTRACHTGHFTRHAKAALTSLRPPDVLLRSGLADDGGSQLPVPRIAWLLECGLRVANDCAFLAAGRTLAVALTKSGETFVACMTRPEDAFVRRYHHHRRRRPSSHSSSCLLPRRVSTEGGERVVGAGVGIRHALLVTSEGGVLAAGSGGNGRLGNGSEEGTLAFRKITSLTPTCRVTACAAGGSFSVLLTDSGRVLTFGAGRHGQLGHGDTAVRLRPTLVDQLDGERVLQIAAGWAFVLAVAEGGSERTSRCFSWGHNRRCQLGHGGESKSDLLMPRLVDGLVGLRICAIAAGEKHSLFAVSRRPFGETAGCVLSCGYNNFGQLGHRHVQSLGVPSVIGGLQSIVHVAAGESHSVAVTAEGDALGFGQDRYGQLGFPLRPADSYRPRPMITDDRVVSAACGKSQTLLLTAGGEMFTCGRGPESPTCSQSALPMDRALRRVHAFVVDPDSSDDDDDDGDRK